ncbi:hypothetical protein HMI55_000041 [Coelomomyces lativittatus]|nr:hypothetical protein HMI55_000041 [Coelomomyces lativittatus]
MGTALLLYKYTVPTEDEYIKRLPEGVKVQLRNQKAEIVERNKLFMQVLKANAESDLPIWDVRGLDSVFKDLNK